MTLSSSLNAGVSGLAGNAGRLATISDNIANSSTYGYKRAETDFASLVVPATTGGYTAGGVTTSTQRTIDIQGAMIGTGNALDVAVVGRGMLPVATVASLDSATTPQLLLKPTGSFSTDAEGLLRTADGFALLGWPVGTDGVTAQRPRDSVAGLDPVNVSSVQFAASPTTNIELGLNLPQTATRFDGTGDTLTLPVEYFDNVGSSQRLVANFTPDIPGAGSSNSWTLSFDDEAGDPALNPVASYELLFSDATGTGGSLISATPISGGTYDPVTGAATITVARGDIDIMLGPDGSGSSLSQLASDFAPVRISKNGTAAGTLTGLEFDQGGYLFAIYDTGFRRPVFQVPLVAVPNPNGLGVASGQTFEITPSSGPFYLWDSGAGAAGVLNGYTLEESTTDIAGELTALIRTQRAYSSNAKVIQTVDEMLQETANIKR